jgi:hypothetical protein
LPHRRLSASVGAAFTLGLIAAATTTAATAFVACVVGFGRGAVVELGSTHFTRHGRLRGSGCTFAVGGRCDAIGCGRLARGVGCGTFATFAAFFAITTTTATTTAALAGFTFGSGFRAVGRRHHGRRRTSITGACVHTGFGTGRRVTARLVRAVDRRFAAGRGQGLGRTFHRGIGGHCGCGRIAT